jgi:hypothetical protein
VLPNFIAGVGTHNYHYPAAGAGRVLSAVNGGVRLSCSHN